MSPWVSIGLGVALTVVSSGCGDDDAAGADVHEVTDTGRDVASEVSVDAPGDVVDVRGDATEVEDPCPTPVIQIVEGAEVAPRTHLHLIGSQSRAPVGPIAVWQWRVEQPEGASGVFLPTAMTPDPVFEVNVVGSYRFTLDVIDMFGTRSCLPASLEVVVTTEHAILLELTWITPGDPDPTDDGPTAGADLDLRLVGDPGGEPVLARDDGDGAGPELLAFDAPAPGCYTIEAHHVDDHGFGPSEATLRVYFSGGLVHASRAGLEAGDLWTAARFCWPAEGPPPPPEPVLVCADTSAACASDDECGASTCVPMIVPDAPTSP